MTEREGKAHQKLSVVHSHQFGSPAIMKLSAMRGRSFLSSEMNFPRRQAHKLHLFSHFSEGTSFSCLFQTSLPFIPLEGLYLVLKHHFAQQKHDFRSSRVSTRPRNEGAGVASRVPKGPELLSREVARTESTLQKRNRVTANHKIMLKK